MIFIVPFLRHQNAKFSMESASKTQAAEFIHIVIHRAFEMGFPGLSDRCAANVTPPTNPAPGRLDCNR